MMRRELNRVSRTWALFSSFVIVAACAGRSIEERGHGSGTGGTGGKSGTGGATGGAVQHESDGGSGGRGGLGGTAGTGGGIGGAGFGGTAGTFNIAGASGETCVPGHADLAGESCDTFAGCLDPLSPEPDFVWLNPPVVTGGNGGAAGEGGVTNEAGAGNTDGPTPGSTALEIAPCEPVPMLPPDASYFLAYDLFVPDTVAGADVPVLAWSLGDCEGVVTGDVVRGCAPPVPGTTTTQCLRLDGSEVTHLLLIASDLDDGSLVSNPRFVTGCVCPFEYQPWIDECE